MALALELDCVQNPYMFRKLFFKWVNSVTDCEFILYHLFPKAHILYYCLFSSIHLICILVICSLLLPSTNLQQYYDHLLVLTSLLLTFFDISSSSLHTETTDRVFIFSHTKVSSFSSAVSRGMVGNMEDGKGLNWA
jgi:hypothetical protein